MDIIMKPIIIILGIILLVMIIRIANDIHKYIQSLIYRNSVTFADGKYNSIMMRMESCMRELVLSYTHSASTHKLYDTYIINSIYDETMKSIPSEDAACIRTLVPNLEYFIKHRIINMLNDERRIIGNKIALSSIYDQPHNETDGEDDE